MKAQSRLHRLICLLGAHEWHRLAPRHRRCVVCGRREYWYADAFWIEIAPTAPIEAQE